MSAVKMLEDGDVPPAMRGVFELVRREYGFLPNILKAVAHCPSLFMAFVPFWAEVYKSPAIGPRLRAISALGTARAQDCKYCIAHMTRSAIRGGVETDELSAIACHSVCETFNEKEKLAVELAERLTKDPKGIDSDTRKRMAEVFTQSELVNVAMAIGLYNMMSRILTLLEIEVEPELDRPVSVLAAESAEA